MDGLSWQGLERQRGTVLAWLYVSGASLVLIGVMVASWQDADRTALLGIVAAAYVAGGLLAWWSRQRPLTDPVAEALVAGGGLLVSAGVYVAGPQGAPVIAVFYVYVSAYAFFYFPTSHALAHTAFAAATYGLALWLLDAPSALSSWVVISGAAASAGGLVGGLGAQMRNRYESERLTARELRSAGEVRTALMRAAGHDLRTPLATIAGFTELLLEHDLDEEQRHEMLQRLRRNSERVQGLLDDLLDLDRIESGHRALRLSDVALHTLVEDVATRSDLEGQRLLIDARPVVIRADRVMVERIVDNLLGNAAKYAPEDSPISVRVEPLAAGARITVEDAGPGIPEGLGDRLFDPFVRGEQPGTGTGIGLYLVDQFARLHGGTATVDPPSDVGARFQVDLPAEPRQFPPT